MHTCATPSRLPAASARLGAAQTLRDALTHICLKGRHCLPALSSLGEGPKKERLIGERISLPWVVDNCSRSLLIRQPYSRPAWSAAMRRNFTRLLETPTLFGGGNATVPKCAAVVCCRLMLRRSMRWFEQASTVVQKAHTGCGGAISGIAPPKTECCLCQSAPNHHTKPRYHSGQGPDGNVVADPCRELLAYI
jgi:hypothetical protein